MRAYYNENDAYAAQWLRNLVEAGHITAGDVDERSIVDVRPADVAGYVRCHWFAGIGAWDYALRLAGWPDDRPVWTGSCPCQPFSAAGRQAGFDDERHLWPVWFDLIRECRPSVVLGEQVEAAVRLGWLDAVLSDLEGEGYACAAAVLGAHSVGAPHIRQRLWFVADADCVRPEGSEPARSRAGRGRRSSDPGCADLAVADAAGERRHGSELTRASGAAPARSSEAGERRPAGFCEPSGCGATVALAGVLSPRLEGRDARPLGDECATAERSGASGGLGHTEQQCAGRHAGAGAGTQEGASLRTERHDTRTSGAAPWSDLIWLPCQDGKARPTQPGLQPLAHGVSARVGRLRAYGNAIVPQAAAAFIGAYLDTLLPAAAE